MKTVAGMMGCVIAGFCLLAPARALQVSPAKTRLTEPWWVSAEFGEGQLKLASDQRPGDRVPTFALGFAGGRQVGQRMRLGLKLNGWLLQAFSPNDPTKGVSVSNVMGIADVFPSPRYRVFVRGGLGWASYTNNQAPGLNGNGLAWETGAGYEIPLRSHVRLVPMAEYAAGRFGDAHDPAEALTGRTYSVFELKVALVYRFGRH